MALFGLTSTADWEAYRNKNIRRSVQYAYPAGKAPLMGLLSLMDEEYTNDPEFGHWEYRWVLPRTETLTQGSGKGPVLKADGSDAGATPTLTSHVEFIFCVKDATMFREGRVVQLSLKNTSGKTVRAIGTVTQVVARTGTPHKIKVRMQNEQANIKNDDTTNVGAVVRAIGSSYAQGRSNVRGEYVRLPIKITNYTQIFRTPFSLPRTALKAPLKYDKTGAYKSKAKRAALDHMVDMEMAAYFGTKDSYVKPLSAGDEAVSSTGEGLVQTTTGGLLYHLEQWEAGAYGDVTATNDDDEDKRIIENDGGTISEEWFNSIVERAFRRTSNVSNEKLVLCGNVPLLVLNQMWKRGLSVVTSTPATEAYGMDIISVKAPFGMLHFKTHPLFNDDPELRNWMVFLDINNIKYRPLDDSDTTLLKNQREGDFDGRRDAYLTEAGLEFFYPESHLIIKNVQRFVP